MTDFGYQQVSPTTKSKLVKAVFDSVADNYDVMNDIMSLGLHRVWKFLTIERMHIRAGQKILDLACGTCDLAVKLTKKVGAAGQVIACDINFAMLNIGRDRVINQNLIDNISFVLADAEHLPFASNYFDAIVIGFGLRNVTDQSKALAAMLRVLKPGGQLFVLEFSKPIYSCLNFLYDLYSLNILPKLGKLIANDSDSYRYLVESIRMHPCQNTLKTMLEDVGFERVAYQNLNGGIVTLHTGYKF